MRQFLEELRDKHKLKGQLWRYYALFTTVTGMLAAHTLSKLEGDIKAKKIKKLNTNYFFITLIIFIFLVIANLVLSIEHKIILKSFYIHSIFSFILGLYLISRANEVFIAFLADAIDQLSPKKDGFEPCLKYYERIPLAMKSYIELMLVFGILYYLLNLFTVSFANKYYIWDMVYYSGVTMTTLGYGEIVPTHFLSKYLSIYSVINGFSLLIISFTIYVSRSIEDKEYDKKT